LASNYETRTRSYKSRGLRGRYYETVGGVEQNSTPQDSSSAVAGTQTTVSKGNPWPPRKSGFQGDVGGDFQTTASYAESHIPYEKLKGITRFGVTYRYDGKVCASSIGPSGKSEFPPSTRSSNDDLDEMGATAVARCSPTNSIANVSVFLGELMRDGIPRVLLSRDWQKGASAARAAGDDYLNAQFGWRPLVSDVTSIAEAIRTSDDAIQQLRRDSGRLVRRQYQFPTTTSSETESLSYGSGYMPGFGQLARFLEREGVRERLVETERRQWFSGAFTYYFPDSSKAIRNLVSYVPKPIRYSAYH